MRNKIKKFILFYFLTLSAPLYSYGPQGEIFAINASAGLPQLIGLEFNFIGMDKFQAGFGYGIFPINSYIQDGLEISDLAIDSSYSIRPTTDFNLSAPSIFIRYFPNTTGLFWQLSYTSWNFGASISGSLIDSENEVTIFEKAIAGNLDITINNIGGLIGYQTYLENNFYLQGAVGAAYLLSATPSISVNGEFSKVQSFIPSLSSEFEIAKKNTVTEIQHQLDKLMSEYRFLPLFFISLGKTF